MKKRYILLIILLSIFIGIPLILHLSWLLTTHSTLNVLVINKTAIRSGNFHHLAYQWVFSHRKYVNDKGSSYHPGKDHLGFFPMQDSKFAIRDFASMKPIQAQELMGQTDLVYFIDNYGVYSHDWYHSDQEHMPYYKIYGGLEQEDLEFVRGMLSGGKVVMAEFNFFAPPTSPAIRQQAEQLLEIQWQGWTGRFFPSLELKDNDFIPSWLVNLYKEQNQGKWPFTKEGIGFIHEDNRVVILEYPTHLLEPAPMLFTGPSESKKYRLPRRVPFPGWFDITLPASEQVHVISWYQIPVTAEGRRLMDQYNIPVEFPAVMEKQSPGQFYYFAGDFAKVQVPGRFVSLKGARYIELFLTDLRDPAIRKGFFFAYYLPLTTAILKHSRERETATLQAQIPSN